MRLPRPLVPGPKVDCLLEWGASQQKKAFRLCRAEPAMWWVQPLFWGTLAAVISPPWGLLGALFTAWISAPRRNNLRFALLLGFGAVACRVAWITPKPLTLQQSQAVTEGVVANFPMREQPPTCIAQAQSMGLVLLKLKESQFCPEPGSRIQWKGQLDAASEAGNPGGFSEKRWLQSLGIRAVLQIDSLVILKNPGLLWRTTLTLRRELTAIIQRHVPPRCQALVRSTVLGDMKGLDPSVKRDFQNTGMLHILAISGQHIALAAAIGIQAFHLIRMPKQIACGAIALGLILYGPATGNSASVVRSIWMFWLILPPIILRRPVSPWTSLSVSAGLSLALEPESISQVGWQLSYLATLALLMHVKSSERLAEQCISPRRLPGRVGQIGRLAIAAIALSVAVTLATLPIIASTSHVIMPVAPLANLITVPLGSGLLTGAILTASLAFFPIGADWMGTATGFFAWALQTTVHTLAQWKSGLLILPAWPLALSFLWVTLALLWPFIPANARRSISLGILILGVSVWAFRQGYETLNPRLAVHVLDVGQGQAVLITLADKTLLFDAGPQRPDAGFRALLPTLRDQGYNRLDAVFLSHGDADHVGGLISLIGEIPIGQVGIGGPWPDDGLWPGIADKLVENGIPMGPIQPGQTLLNYGPWSLRTLDLHIGTEVSRNNGSSVLILEGPQARLVIPGDIESRVENTLADSVEMWSKTKPKKPLWLIIPHHGSDRTGDTAALARMRPEIALISAGKANKFGHPGPSTLATLERIGAKTYLTAVHGALILNADTRHATWSVFRGETM